MEQKALAAMVSCKLVIKVWTAQMPGMRVVTRSLCSPALTRGDERMHRHTQAIEIYLGDVPFLPRFFFRASCTRCSSHTHTRTYAQTCTHRWRSFPASAFWEQAVRAAVFTYTHVHTRTYIYTQVMSLSCQCALRASCTRWACALGSRLSPFHWALPISRWAQTASSRSCCKDAAF
jgi:hypothetical protein